jgi:tetratricopeptide (TPR) repeat protein
VAVFTGSPDAGRLSAEVLSLGQALGVDTRQLAGLFQTRGLYLAMDGQYSEAAVYYRESARLATQAGDSLALGHALLNLSFVQVAADPADAAEAARTAAGHLRRTGARKALAIAIANLAQPLLMLGDWDAAEAELTQAADSDGLTDHELLACYRAWLAALRGDAATAQTILAALPDLRASEDPQDKSLVLLMGAFTGAARRQPQEVLCHARGTLTHVDTLGISHEYFRWAWALAARTACDLGDTDTTGELLAMLDGCQPDRLPPMLRAERDLVRARLAAYHGDPATAGMFTAAISSVRQHGSPYHLAHGLLDHAEYLLARQDSDAAAAAISEAREITERLRCQPLLDRADTIQPRRPRTLA